ncbi:hypothetical protein SSX86_023348 [Deinandra increscens subsp. villosa]|uniref:CRIB domain-containing protein n=1 Tax=Deinandra increscens subsp. villosa TaxID=3103831 RepID=A0AAP0CM46_9ASTR
MKETVSRFLLLPFYMNCWKMKGGSKPATMEGESSASMVKSKRSWPSRSDISKVMDRLIRSTFKSVVQIFAYKDIEDVESEKELEIGFPTDVKHVTHIGCDGTLTTNADQNWDHLQPPETLSFPSNTLEQLALQMADTEMTKIEKHEP